jgi:TPR repeat protein
MNLPNKSTPSLQPQSHTSPAEMAYDPSQLNFDALHISEPPRRASSTVGHGTTPVSATGSGSGSGSVADNWVNLNAQDPIPRTGTAMSYDAYASSRNPRHAQTLPATGWQPGSIVGDTQSVRSFDSQQYASSASGTYSYDQQSYYGQQQSYDDNKTQAYGQYGYDQYGQYNTAAAAAAAGGAGAYDPQYAAYYNQYQQYPQYGTDYAGGEYANGGYGAGYDQSQPQASSRPPIERSAGTFADMPASRSQKLKAVDLSQPPYTREYVEQYRARIKGDPDPEAHFAYAKYLIDAAKKIGAKAADQRAVRKYRETLLAEALKTIRRLATQGDAYAEAQFFLANCCGSGLLGLQVDHERAYHLYLQAAKQNHAAGSYRVAVCNELGVGTRKDASRAFAFYRKAASLGDTAAMYKLGMVLLSGSLGQPKNTREAVGWLKRAAEQADEENPHALHDLGLLHEQPNSNAVIHDEAYAKDLFTKAAQLGFVASQYKLGFCYEYGLLGCAIDPKRSIAWYTKAAEKGDAEAELALSGWYLTGSEGVLPQSDAEAYLWARRAANKGLSKAEFAVGYYAEQGIGVKQDIEFAKRWYMRAAGE